MIKKFRKRIDDDIVSLVECSNYVVDGSKNVILRKYEEDYISYEIIKNQLDYEYISDLVESFNLKNIQWTLTYASKELLISIDYDDVDKSMHEELNEYLQCMGFIEIYGCRR